MTSLSHGVDELADIGHPEPTPEAVSTIRRREVDAIVVGGGISGIAASVRLRRDAGLAEVLLLEKGHQLGGMWCYNTYPGSASDVPAPLHSFEFAPNPEWSRTFATQPEMLAYIQRVADEFGVTERTLFDTDVTAAQWHEPSQRWWIDTTDGAFATPVFVFEAGTPDEPATPAVPGLDVFEGVQFHSARWNHDHDLADERVAVVGSGVSAVQLIPRIQPTVRQLVSLQPTAGWVWPKVDRPTTAAQRAMYRRFPSLQRAVRARQLRLADRLLEYFLARRPAHHLDRVSKAHLRFRVRDRALRRILTPTGDTGGTRLTTSNDYYPALTRKNVVVVPHGVREVRARSIVSDDGTEHHVDTIIWATGRRAVDAPLMDKLVGQQGHSLADVWGGRPRALMGTSVSGFPNAFLLGGPNSGTGNDFLTGEAQLNFVVEAVRALRVTGAASFDIRDEVVEAWKAEMSTALEQSTWASGPYRDAVYGGTWSEFLARGVDFELLMFDVTWDKPAGAAR